MVPCTTPVNIGLRMSSSQIKEESKIIIHSLLQTMTLQFATEFLFNIWWDLLLLLDKSILVVLVLSLLVVYIIFDAKQISQTFHVDVSSFLPSLFLSCLPSFFHYLIPFILPFISSATLPSLPAIFPSFSIIPTSFQEMSCQNVGVQIGHVTQTINMYLQAHYYYFEYINDKIIMRITNFLPLNVLCPWLRQSESQNLIVSRNMREETLPGESGKQ